MTWFDELTAVSAAAVKNVARYSYDPAEAVVSVTFQLLPPDPVAVALAEPFVQVADPGGRRSIRTTRPDSGQFRMSS